MELEIDLLDKKRIELNSLLENKAELGQYLTSVSIARFMASFFEKEKLSNPKILDAGAGIGALTASLLERIVVEQKEPIQCECTLVEIDDILGSHIKNSLDIFKDKIDIDLNVISEDFLYWATNLIDNTSQKNLKLYSLAILNPPYKKMKSNSSHRKALDNVGIKTVNLYSAFVSLAIKLLEDNGQLVAIIPRSFCNGAYYRSFRELILNETTIKRIHLFKSRNKAFKDDDVLQENIIIHLEKNGTQQDVHISTSTDDSLNDYSEKKYSFEQIVEPNDSEFFFRIPSSEKDISLEVPSAIKFRLEELQLKVSTGPIVSFRMKQYIKILPEENTVPLLYPTHITNKGIEWVKLNHKKPNAILRNDNTEKLLYPMGYYLILRRRTAKEEEKRIISAVIEPNSFEGYERIGIDNGVNIIHFNKNGLTKDITYGLDMYLKSTFVDQYFRSFNGSTQVNATDLRTMLFPSRKILEELGKWRGTFNTNPLQEDIDSKLREMINMEDTYSNIQKGIEIIKALGLPKGQQNERTSLCLLALLKVGPDDTFEDAQARLIGITPIMNFCETEYGHKYAPNTRETFRRHSIHQFLEAGIVLYNPDDPLRAVNSPKAVYQIEQTTLDLIKSFGKEEWELNLSQYLASRQTLVEKYAKERKQNKIPVTLVQGTDIFLTPGKHSELIRDIIKEFGSRFVPAGTVLYAGDTGEKLGLFDKEGLKDLGIEINTHGKMPDVIMYYPEKNWLILIEAVTSHGPVDGKRHAELEILFKEATVGIVYVTAFPDRKLMSRYVSEIAWETEVWVADAPSHLIHFNGVRFLGPY